MAKGLGRSGSFALSLIFVSAGIWAWWSQSKRQHHSEPQPKPAAAGFTEAGAARMPSLNAALPKLDHSTASTLDERLQTLLARYATGDFVGALQIADDSIQDVTLDPVSKSWLVAQMPVLLTSAGWAKLKLGACEEAIPLLRRAEALQRSPETAKGLGICHYKLRQMSAARDQLAWYLERRSDDQQIPLLYADTLESEGRWDEAVRVLEQVAQTPCTPAADSNCPNPEAINQRLASMRGREKESWWQQHDSSRHFRLAYRAGDHEDLVAYVLQELEDALDDYTENFGFRHPKSSIEVILYPADDFANVVVGGPSWAEGLFDGRIRLPIRDSLLREKRFRELRIVLRHELVHALFAQMSDHRSLPPWLDEGLAQLLSCRPDCEAFRFPPSPGGFLPLTSFETPYIGFDPITAGRAYRQSLYLVSLLQRRHNIDGLRQIISSVSTSNELSSDAMLSSIQMSFRDLHRYAADLWQRRTPL